MVRLPRFMSLVLIAGCCALPLGTLQASADGTHADPTANAAASVSTKAAASAPATTSASVSAPAAPLLRPFVLSLDVEKLGMRLGVTRLELTLSENHQYRFVLSTKTSGLARWFVRDEVTEISEGVIDETGIVPHRYQFDQSGGSEVVQLSTVFDWDKGEAVTTGSKGRVVHELVPGTVDRLSIYLAVMTHLKRQQPGQLSLPMIDKTKLYEYSLEPLGLEKLTSPVGSLTTLVLKRSNDRPERLTRIWMAPEFDYLPVRIRQDTNGSKDFEMFISTVSGFPTPAKR